MKILYIAIERQAAQRAAHALRGIGPQIALSWARTLASALRWIEDNRDVTAIVVEAEAQRHGLARFGEDVRAVGSTAPVVVVAREQADLAEAVNGALARGRAAARDADICTALQSRLFDLEASTESLTEQLRLTTAALADASGSRASLERLLADRDAELRTARARHDAAEQAAQQALAQAQEAIQLASARAREIGTLQQQIETLGRELPGVRAEADALRSQVTRIPLLQMQIEQDRKEAHSQFERTPYPLCRCTPNGSIMQANHSFARLLGYRKAEDLRETDLGSVFECANDFRWLIERSTQANTTEAVETTWKTTDRRRVHVRLHALAAATGSIEIAVENITGFREVEERLRLAQRMEAVGRLASEVAVTCESLLRDGEVSRVAGLLRQLSVYGDRQISALEPVSVEKVLRNLGPVLKRLAGDDVRIVLPKTSAPFEVDVDAERVERILVNVAGYARERMPHGGRIKIDLATTVVDRRFLARHPGVRPGTHVLLTVTEVRGTIRGVLPIRAHPEHESAAAAPAPKPGLDLGALLGLIADCEGHLWMAAEPSGNMTLKIYLPCRDAVAASETGAAPVRSGRGRQLARWFGH